MTAEYDTALARYRALVQDNSDLPVKGKAMPYTALNGNMFTFLDKNAVLCMRLEADDRAVFEAAFGTGPVMQYGSVMKDYVPMPADLSDTNLAKYFDMSLRYARTLKPKPTKKGG